MSPVSLPDRVRAACAWVAGRSRSVEIEADRIEEYAAGLATRAKGGDSSPPADRGQAAAFAICVNAINFGSGWWPTIDKRPGHSGYATMAAGVRERFDLLGPWQPQELVEIDVVAVATTVGQDPAHPLMGQFAAALRDLGARLLADHDGSYLALVEGASSLPDLVETLAGWACFADASPYDGREVPFYKRAQLAAADLQRAGVADLPGIERLTAFADNLVPHVLRVDGVLRLDPDLAAAIDAGELLEHGSPAEVELRACAVEAVELLSRASAIAPAILDGELWNRGRGSRYKAIPRPRSRNTAY
jgi:Potential Queuosine, Q, salvage protein family